MPKKAKKEETKETIKEKIEEIAEETKENKKEEKKEKTDSADKNEVRNKNETEKGTEADNESDDSKTLFTININKKNIWQITTVILGILVLLSFSLRGPLGGITGAAVADPSLQPAEETGNDAAGSERIEVSAENDVIKGQKNAPVTIIEFSDYQCPYCAKFYSETFSQIDKEYIKTGKVKIVFRDYPLDFHQYAMKAAVAAECAGKQGKYWEMHNKLFENQKDFSNENFKKWAKEIGVAKIDDFNKCFDSDEPADEIKKDMNDASKYGIRGTPAFFVNGRKIVGAYPFAEFKRIIDEELNS